MSLGLWLRLGIRTVSALRARHGAPDGHRVLRRAWSLVEPALRGRLPTYGRERDLSGSLVIPPSPMPCSETPAEPVVLADARTRLASGRRAAPLPGGCRTRWITMKGFRLHPSPFPGLTLTLVGRI